MTLNIHNVDNICQAQCHPIASKRLQTLDATHLSSGQVGLDAGGVLGSQVWKKNTKGFVKVSRVS